MPEDATIVDDKVVDQSFLEELEGLSVVEAVELEEGAAFHQFRFSI